MSIALMAITVSAAIIGQLGDCITTEAGLAGGLKEGNKIATWLVNKIGNVGMAFLKCAGAAQLLPIVGYHFGGDLGLELIAGIIGFWGFLATFLNYRLMKKSGIPFSF